MFVIKGSLRSGGSGTAVGRDLTGSEWRARISAALASDEQWVVQEWIDREAQELAFMIEGELEFRPCQLDYGVFMFDHRFAGAALWTVTTMSRSEGSVGGEDGILEVDVGDAQLVVDARQQRRLQRDVGAGVSGCEPGDEQRRQDQQQAEAQAHAAVRGTRST